MLNKRILFLAVVVLFLTVSAVGAADNFNSSDIDEGVLEDSGEIPDADILKGSASHTVNAQNYNDYFNEDTGEMVSLEVNEGDTLYFDGPFDKTDSAFSFTFNKRVNVVGTASNSMRNSSFTFKSGASGSVISSLKIDNNRENGFGIFLDGASNCTVRNCVIACAGLRSYAVCLNSNSNYNNITGNVLKTYAAISGTKSTSAIILGGANYNYIANNAVTCDDANAIFLSNIPSGFFNGGESFFNVVYNNTIRYDVAVTSWAHGIRFMGGNNTADSNIIIGAYSGISVYNGGGNVIINNEIVNIDGADFSTGLHEGGDYAICAAHNSKVINNTIVNVKLIGAGIYVGVNSIVENNKLEVSKGKGIELDGSNITVKNNNIFTDSSEGILLWGKYGGVTIEANNITCQNSAAVSIRKSSNRNVPFNITVVGNNITVALGQTAIYLTNDPAEYNYTIEANNITYINMKSEDNRLQTTLIASDMTATYNNGKYLVVTLMDTKNNAVAGASVSISLNGITSILKTDANGQVKIPTYGLAPNVYPVTISFEGTDDYFKSSVAVKITVKKATAKLTAKMKTFKKSKKIKKYTVVLKDNTGKAIKKAKLTLKIKGKTYKATTNKKGKATFKITKLSKKGKYNAVIKYKGDKYYNKLTKKVKIVIK